MFVPFILPFQITATALGVLVVCAVLILPRFGMKLVPAILLSLLLAGIAFIPLCAGIKSVVDSARFGGFAYGSTASITDPYIEIPPSATDITVYRTGMGHHTRFTVPEDELQKWLVGVRAEYERSWHGDPMITASTRALTRDDFAVEFGTFGWEYPPDNFELVGPSAPNGAGFSIWYSPNQGKAYLRAGYW